MRNRLDKKQCALKKTCIRTEPEHRLDAGFDFLMFMKKTD
jgi:hypothetical protein